MNYRKFWINNHGEIPVDVSGRPFDIHHIDGNRKNNNLNNLICVSVDDHLKIHLKQYEDTGSLKDLASYRLLCGRLNRDVKSLSGFTLSEETKEKIRKKLTGTKRPPEVRKKCGDSLIGFKWSKEDIESRGRGLKKYYETASKEELKERWKKISDSNTGKKVKDSTKEKLSKINSKLTDEDVLEIDKLINSGERYKTISERFNISQAQITAIKQKKTYKWLWNY
jgi:hypothetical protein